MSAISANPAAAAPRSRNRAWGKFKRNHIAMLGLAIVLFFVALALLAPLVANHDPFQTSFTTIRKAPSAQYWLGTDELGRDIFSRMVYGARASLMAGLVSVLAVGVPFGLAAGYFGGWTDSCISRATEALLAIPLPDPGDRAGRLPGAQPDERHDRHRRVGRAQVHPPDARAGAGGQERGLCAERPRAGRVGPAHHRAPRVPQRHAAADRAGHHHHRHGHHRRGQPVVPGLGLQPPNPSWGSMLNTAKNFMTQAPWMSIFPGSAIFLVVLGFNLLGDGLRDALDPRQEK